MSEFSGAPTNSNGGIFSNLGKYYNRGREIAKGKLTQLVKSGGDVVNYLNRDEESISQFGELPVNVNTEPYIMRAQSCIPSVEEWPNRPLLVRQSPVVHRINGDTRSEIIQIHKPGPAEESVFDCSSEYFVGKAYLIVAAVPGAPLEYFRGKKRWFQFIVQGRFLQPLSFAEVYTGQAFEWELPVRPPEWVLRSLRPLLTYLQPGARLRIGGPHPYLLSPLVSTMQHVDVSKPGEEPSIASHLEKIKDNLRHHGEMFEDMSAHERKQYFSKEENLEKYHYDTEMIYTFDFYEHLLNLSTLRLDLGVAEYDILQVLGPRCLRLTTVVWKPPPLPAASASGAAAKVSSPATPSNEVTKTNRSDRMSGSESEEEEVPLMTPSEPVDDWSDPDTSNSIASTNAATTAGFRQDDKPEPWKYLYDIEIWHERCLFRIPSPHTEPPN